MLCGVSSVVVLCCASWHHRVLCYNLVLASIREPHCALCPRDVSRYLLRMMISALRVLCCANSTCQLWCGPKIFEQLTWVCCVVCCVCVVCVVRCVCVWCVWCVLCVVCVVVLWCCVVCRWVCVQDFRGCVQDLLPPLSDLPSVGPPKMSRFFFLSRHNFHSFFPLSGGLLVEFWWCVLAGTLKCARLGSPNVHISGPLRPPPKFHQKTPREGEKERKLWRERVKKNSEILGSHPSGRHPSGPNPPTLRGPTLRGPTIRGLVFTHPGGREGGGERIGLVEKISMRYFLGLSRKKGPIGPSRIGLSRIGPSRACPNQSPLHFLMRLYRRLYTASQLMMPPHNYRSRSSFSGAPSPMTL